LSDTIGFLRDIQRIDSEIDAVNGERQRYRDDIKAVEDHIERLKEEAGAVEAELASLAEEKKDRDEKIRQCREKIEKDRTRLSDIKNDKQYKALNKGISGNEKAMKLLEFELSALDEKLNARSADAAAKAGELGEKTERLASLVEGLERKNSEWEAEIRTREAERSSVASNLKPAQLKRYETIKAKRGGIGIINVVRETCQGCYIQIPPQVFNQLMKGTEEIMTCPHCHRMLYFDDSKETTCQA